LVFEIGSQPKKPKVGYLIVEATHTMSSVVERLQKLRNRLNASGDAAASVNNDTPAKEVGGGNENNANNDETSETDAQPKSRRGPIRSGGAKASPRDEVNDDGKKNEEGDIEMGINNRNQALVKQIEQSGPLRVLEPIRADPIKLLQTRQRRLERVAASSLPEIHFVGHITSGLGLINDTTEGACCR